MKYHITYTIDTDQPTRRVHEIAGATDLIAHLRRTFGGGVVNVLIEGDTTALDRKVSDLTVKELFDILDVTADLTGQNRRQQEEIQERIKALLAATIEMEKVRAHGITVQAIHSCSELQELFNVFDKDFVKGGYAGCKKLLLLYAWAQE